MFRNKIFVLGIGLLLLQGCRVIIEGSPDGFVISDSGLYDCPQGQTCTYAFDGVPINDSFTAIPAPGYRFTGWQSADNKPALCNNKMTSCAMQGVSTIFTALDVDTYLIPGFEPDTTTDSDGDGVADISDAFPNDRSEYADSDGDGLGDNADPYPFDGTLPVGNEEPPGEVIINAYNADMVVYATGAFVQLSETEWVENNADGAKVFHEVARDEWSIYLDDPTRDVQIQLDLHRKEILYTDPNTAFVLYAITGVNPDVITGWAANRAYYDDIFGSRGGFVQLNAVDWVQNGEDGGYFEFTEVSRDPWSVYLQDASRGVFLQLDFFWNRLVYSDASIQNWIIGDITDADPQDPEEVSALVVREVRTDHSYFLLNQPRTWVETLVDGSQYSFTETYRDEWSVKMFEPVRGINIWIDLHTNLVQYYFNQGEDWQLYEPDNIPWPGPIAWYTFDGGTPQDASGRNNHLTWGPGYVYQDANGVRNEALYLSGDNTSAILPDGIMSKIDDFTISAFVKLNQLEQWSRVFDFGDGTSNYMFLTPLGGANTVRFAMRTGGGPEQIIDGEAPLGGSNGYSAFAVMYNAGAFVRLNTTQWVHNSVNAPVVFTEVRRDQWSVYLRNEAADLDVQLDLFTRQIIYTDPNRTYVLAHITSYNPYAINGYAASRIRHPGGRFSQLTPTMWIEDDGNSNDGSGSFAFEEVRRDQWSVYLHDPNRNVDIQLDLYRKKIIYSDAVTPATDLYDITSTTPFVNDNNWIHVAVTKEGNVGTLYVAGAAVGTNPNMTSAPSDMGFTTQNWLGRSQYANDPRFKGSIDDFRIYNRALSQIEVQTIAGPDPRKISFMGSDVELTREELRDQLAAQGLTLVEIMQDADVTQIGFDECVTMYTEADRDDLSGKAGILACNSSSSVTDSKISVRVIYGGCDVKTQGAGLECEGGVYAQVLRRQIGDGLYEEWTMRGPNAYACGAVSLEKTCLGAYVNVIDVSYLVESERGSGGGLGVGVGVGIKGGIEFEDGVLTINGSAKLGAGFTLSASLAEEDVLEVVQAGETAFVTLGGEIVGVGEKVLPEFQQFGNEVHDIGDDIVGGLRGGGQEIVIYAEDLGQSAVEFYADVEAALPSAAQDVAGGMVDTAGLVAEGISDAGGEAVTYVGQAAGDVVNYCTQDYRNCIPSQYGGRL